jgi:hypothetical protein
MNQEKRDLSIIYTSLQHDDNLRIKIIRKPSMQTTNEDSINNYARQEMLNAMKGKVKKKSTRKEMGESSKHM